MTWPDGIALAIGLIAAYLLNHNPHRSTRTTPPAPQDGEPRT